MSKYDVQYAELVNKVLTEGISDEGHDVRTVWVSDGTPAHSRAIVSHDILIDSSEVPLLTTKYVPWKSAIHEIIWFYIKRTSDVTYLRENNVVYWEDWTRPDNTIGKAYGYQLGKPVVPSFDSVSGYRQLNQVENIIRQLRHNPSSRRLVIEMWNIDDLWDMALTPCMHGHQCIVLDGTLHLVVKIRSNDLGLGNPVNIFQMHVYHRMLCQVTGLKLGTLKFNINIPHIYSRHEEGLREQISRTTFTPPQLWINPAIKEFDDFTIDDFLLVSPDIPKEFLESATRDQMLPYCYYRHQEKIYYEIAK